MSRCGPAIDPARRPNSIDIAPGSEEGTVYIAATDGEAGERAKAEVEALGAEIKPQVGRGRVGSIYEGKVVTN